MILEYFNPVEKNVLDFTNKLSSTNFGNKIGINGRDGFDGFEKTDIVVFSINDYRDDQSVKKSFNADKDFRKKLYGLHYGNWKFKLYDLGNLISGDRVSDTKFAIEKIIEHCNNNEVFVITVGGTQQLTSTCYNSLKRCLNKINLVTINNRVDFVKNGNVEESYLSKIIMDEDNKFNQYSNIGFQKHLTSTDEIELIDKMKFEALSLGKVKSNLVEAEPILRDANIVSFNIMSIKSGDINNAHQYPNGLTSHEFCSLAMYSGLSSKTKVVSFFENWDFKIINSLLAESVWYTVDGFNSRFDENPHDSSEDFITYFIDVDNYKFKFFKSIVTERWWVEFLNDELINVEKDIISCISNDYYNCKNNIISERILTRLKNKIT